MKINGVRVMLLGEEVYFIKNTFMSLYTQKIE